MPYDTLQAYTGQAKTATLTDARLADYGADHANYQAVILASGDLGHTVTNPDKTTSYLSAFTDAEWATLAKYERTFGIRQLSDYTAPGPAHGLNTAAGASQDGVVGTLTTAGKAAFPYLKGPVQIADDDPTVAETFGYPATPVNAADWQTLLAGPNNTAFLGIYTHPDDGREEMVMTVASQPVPEPQPAAAPRDAQLGHARRLPRLPAQLPRGAGRRPLPRRRRLGPGDAHHELRPGRRRAG